MRDWDAIPIFYIDFYSIEFWAASSGHEKISFWFSGSVILRIWWTWLMAQIFRSLAFCVHSTQNFRDKPLICWSLEFPVPYVPAAAPSLRGASIGSKGLPSEAAAPAPARCPTSRRPSAPSLMVQSRIGARERCDPRGSSRNGWLEMLVLFCMQHLSSFLRGGKFMPPATTSLAETDRSTPSLKGNQACQL